MKGLTLPHFRPEGTNHRPQTEVKLAWDPEFLHVLFWVEDCFIRAVTTEFQGPVYEDSCVEFFLRPHADGGYFNIELNCIGTLLMYFINDPRRTPSGFKDYKRIAPEDGSKIAVACSFPKGVPIEEEITQPTRWSLQASIPFSILNKYLSREIAPARGKRMFGNFFKCGDRTSHPHWASWSEVQGELNFHQPPYFGSLLLG